MEAPRTPSHSGRQDGRCDCVVVKWMNSFIPKSLVTYSKGGMYFKLVEYRALRGDPADSLITSKYGRSARPWRCEGMEGQAVG